METVRIFWVETVLDIVKGIWCGGRGVQGGVTADGDVTFLREDYKERHPRCVC